MERVSTQHARREDRSLVYWLQCKKKTDADPKLFLHKGSLIQDERSRQAKAGQGLYAGVMGTFKQGCLFYLEGADVTRRGWVAKAGAALGSLPAE